VTLGALAVRHDAASAALVRHSIADDLAGRSVSQDSIDDVVLVASELVGNAVVHTAADCVDDLDVAWDVEAEAVVVRVADPSGDLPRKRSTNDLETGGRGLAIVAAIAVDWGVLCSPTGKQVWARVPIGRN
jgi:anti-sigma regulatory factor (Ser/Thr protein kinase)